MTSQTYGTKLVQEFIEIDSVAMNNLPAARRKKYNFIRKILLSELEDDSYNADTRQEINSALVALRLAAGYEDK